MTNSKTDYMGPLRNILLATDGSAYSEGAIKEALYLAKACDSRLAVIYILEVNPEFETEGLKFVEKMELDAREHLERVKKDAAKENVELEVIVRRTDEPYKAIVEEAEKRGTDVIVMGRRGRTGLKKILMGSVTTKVIGHSPCNILIVPKDAGISCKKILIATDGSKYSSAAASKAIDIARRCGSDLTVLAVVPLELSAGIDPDTGYSQTQLEHIAKEAFAATEKGLQEVKTMAEKEGIKAEGTILGGRPHEAIVETTIRKKIDLVVVGSHGRTGLKKLFLGSVAERVVGLSPSAVLVVKV